MSPRRPTADDEFYVSLKEGEEAHWEVRTQWACPVEGGCGHIDGACVLV